MKAAVLVENQKIIIKEIPVKDNLSLNSCRIRVSFTGVCSSDVPRSQSNGAYFYPLVMGHEFSGEVVGVGSGVKNFKKNDRVTVFPLLPCFNCEPCENIRYAQCEDYSYFGSRCDGGYAEYVDVPEWNLLKIPDEVSLKDAALMEPFAVAYHTVQKSGVLESKGKARLALIGSGFIGLLMAEIILAKTKDTTIDLIDRNQFKLDKIRDKRVQKHFLCSENDWSTFLEHDQNTRFDYVIEATGSPKLFSHSIRMIKSHGLLTWMGNITGDLLLPQKLVSSILRKEIKLQGVWNSVYDPQSLDDWKEALNLIKEGINPSAYVTKELTLEEVSGALEKIGEYRRGGEKYETIKLIICFNS